MLKPLPVPHGTRCGLRRALAPVLPLLIALHFLRQDFAMSCREEDAAIPAYCKDDERQGAQKMPQKAWSVFFPYSIPNRTPFYNEIAVKILRLFTPQGEKEGFFRPARRKRRAGRRTSAPRQARTIKIFHVLRHFFSRAGLTCRRKDIIINVCVEKRPFFRALFHTDRPAGQAIAPPAGRPEKLTEILFVSSERIS